MNLQNALTLLGETQEDIEFMPIEFYEYLTKDYLQLILRMHIASKSVTVSLSDRQRAREVVKRAIPLYKAYRTVRDYLRQQQNFNLNTLQSEVYHAISSY